MEILLAGLALGLMGSFHCIGMCGPIALSIPLKGNSLFSKLSGSLLYHFGRTLTYGMLGALFGLIGQGFQMAGFQQWIAIAMGIVMILSVLIPSVFKALGGNKTLPFTEVVRKGLGYLFSHPSSFSLLFIGMLNGLLPCGLVYLAIAGAIGTGSTLYGIVFMLLFGLGTIPMLAMVSMMGNFMGHALRNRLNKIVPFVVVIIGLLFILRGLSLGIPFLSPPAEKLNPDIHQQQNQTTVTDSLGRRSCCGSN